MKVVFTENEQKNSSLETIKILEKNLNKVLPGSYVKFILNINGGLPIPNAISILDNLNNNLIEEYVSYFLGIYPLNSDNDLFENYSEYFNSQNSEYLPIASCYSQNMFLLSLKDENYQHIYYRDHLREDTNSSHNNLLFVAFTFDDFVNQLMPATNI